MGRPLALASTVIAVLLVGRAAWSQPAPQDAPAPGAPAPTATTMPAPPAGTAAPDADVPSGEGGDIPARPLVDLQNAPPPPTNVVYLQYGVALTAEVISAAGPICDNVAVPCILGPGGGVAVRVGWRGTGALYLGGAYELSKQDPNKLLRLAILQQARAEARYYFVSGRDTEPYLAGGLGVAGYGNEWAVDTWGPAGFAGLGLETQITRRTLIGVALAYRLLYFQRFTDTTGAPRDAGVAQLIGLDFVLEQREPIYTEGGAPR
ncbi:MAG: hypothetical protein JWP87_1290 [Labilithrix sp.]|nr:hypothetical protein [Labilithrix sp.]